MVRMLTIIDRGEDPSGNSARYAVFSYDDRRGYTTHTAERPQLADGPYAFTTEQLLAALVDKLGGTATFEGTEGR